MARSLPGGRFRIVPALVTVMALTVFLSGLAAPVEAQQRRYIEWREKDDGAQALVEELRRIIKQAEAQKAADPLLFRDLRDAIGRYEADRGQGPARSADAPSAPRPTVAAPAVRPAAPQRVTLMNDRFDDGDFSTNPTWSVSEGAFWVEEGLRSRALIPKRTPAVDLPRVSPKSIARSTNAIASGDRHRGLARTLAFDADPQSAWKSALEGRAIEGKAYVGQGKARHIGRIHIRQRSNDNNGNAYSVDVQRADATGWQSVRQFNLSPDGTRQVLDLPRSAHRSAGASSPCR